MNALPQPEPQAAETVVLPLPAAPAAPSLGWELLRALRPHQWVKNLLVFVPILLAGRLGDWTALFNTAMAFVALTAIASSTYLVNDLVDLADDRRHWSKRYRPLASGRLPAAIATTFAPIAIVAGLLLGMATSLAVAFFLALYLAVTLAYSFTLKRLPLIDGLAIGGLFAIRLMIGIAAANVRPSAWLLVFAMFLFTSIAYAKRYTEITRSAARKAPSASRRGYREADAPLVLTVGVSAGIGAVLVMILYVVEDAYIQTFYGNTVWLWAQPPILFLLIGRIWMKSARGEMDDDPVEFVLTDRTSIALGVLMAVCFAFAWLGPFRE